MKNRQIKKPPSDAGKLIAKPVDDSGSSSQRDRPLFSFEFVRTAYCISKCTTDEKAALVDTLHKLSKMTWAEFHAAHRHGSGCEKIDRSSIRGDEIPPQVTPDVNLWAFRFCGKAPMVGYRVGRIFHILWLDRDFTLYDHG